MNANSRDFAGFGACDSITLQECLAALEDSTCSPPGTWKGFRIGPSLTFGINIEEEGHLVHIRDASEILRRISPGNLEFQMSWYWFWSGMDALGIFFSIFFFFFWML